MNIRGMRRLTDAVTLQAALDYIKGRRKLDRRMDARVVQRVREAEEFFRSEIFDLVYLPEWAESGEWMIDLMNSNYRTITLKTPKLRLSDEYARKLHRERVREKQENCPGHQWVPHAGRIYDGICRLCGAKHRKKDRGYWAYY